MISRTGVIGSSLRRQSNSNIVLGLHMDGADGSTTFTDVTGKTVSVAGNAKLSTAQSVFGGSSAYFDGNNDYLVIDDSSAWYFNTGNETISCWWRPSSLSSSQMILQQAVDIYSRWILYYNPTRGLCYDVLINGDYRFVVQQGGASGWSINTWYFLRQVRSGNSLALARSGTVIASTTSSNASPDFSAPLYVGGGAVSGDLSVNGYIDDLWIDNGIARSTSEVPAAPFTYP